MLTGTELNKGTNMLFEFMNGGFSYEATTIIANTSARLLR